MKKLKKIWYQIVYWITSKDIVNAKKEQRIIDGDLILIDMKMKEQDKIFTKQSQQIAAALERIGSRIAGEELFTGKQRDRFAMDFAIWLDHQQYCALYRVDERVLWNNRRYGNVPIVIESLLEIYKADPENGFPIPYRDDLKK